MTLELETYRPTKLSGNGQCKCGVCGNVCWTDWFSRYKGKTLCDKCLREILATEEQQTVKDTAKEILDKANELWLDTINPNCLINKIENWIKERYGVEVE